MLMLAQKLNLQQQLPATQTQQGAFPSCMSLKHGKGFGAEPRAESISFCSTLAGCACSSSRRRKRSRSPQVSRSPSRLRQRHGHHKRHGSSRGLQGRHRSSFEGPDGRGEVGAGPPHRGGLGTRGGPRDIRHAGGHHRWRGGPGGSWHACSCCRGVPQAAVSCSKCCWRSPLTVIRARSTRFFVLLCHCCLQGHCRLRGMQWSPQSGLQLLMGSQLMQRSCLCRL